MEWGSEDKNSVAKNRTLVYPGTGKCFSLFQNVQTDSGENPASCSMGTGVLSQR
jgi:hypothetical protein